MTDKTPYERNRERDELVASRCEVLAEDFTERAEQLGLTVEYRGSSEMSPSTMYVNRKLHFAVTSILEDRDLREKLEALRNKPLQCPGLDKNGPEPRLTISVRISPHRDRASPLQGDWYLSADGVVTEGLMPVLPGH